jgi:hypothetical protein
MFKSFFKKSVKIATPTKIFLNTEIENSYENKIAEFDQRCGLLLSKGLIEKSKYFRDRMYYALSESKTC